MESKELEDKIRNIRLLSSKHCKPYYTDFLTETELSEAIGVLSAEYEKNYSVFGGFENAERVMLCVYPDYMKPENSEFPISCMNVKYRKADKLSHRDFLGALMSLGIKRDTVGDIVINDGEASFFVKEELAPYIEAQIDKIGRVGVEFTDKCVDFEKISKEYSEHECTVSSLRIDAVLSAALNISRAKAKKLIESGMVAKNSKIVYNTDEGVNNNDKISARGSGKFIVTFGGDMTRKGRYRIIIRKFI